MIEGKCHLCGKNAPLSFEHLPPKSALNNKKVELLGMMDWLRRGDGPQKGKQYQGGFGAETLCKSCNSNTGAWYVPHLSALVRTGMRMLQDIPHAQLEAANQGKTMKMYMDVRIQGVRPLPIIKQIATMFLALNGPEFRDRYSTLADFVLNKEVKSLPDGYQFHLMFYVGPFTRYSPLEWSLDTNTGILQSITELATPPFCYVLTVENKICIPHGSINHFADHKYEEVSELKMKIPLVFGNTPYPLDFRTKADVQEQRRKSEAARN